MTHWRDLQKCGPTSNVSTSACLDLRVCVGIRMLPFDHSIAHRDTPSLVQVVSLHPLGRTLRGCVAAALGPRIAVYETHIGVTVWTGQSVGFYT